MPFPSRVRARIAVTSRSIPPPLPAASRARSIGWPLFAAAGTLAVVLALLLAGTAWLVANFPSSNISTAAHDTATTQTVADPQNRPAEKHDPERAIEPIAALAAEVGPNVTEHDRPNLTPLPDPYVTEKSTAIFAPLKALTGKEAEPAGHCNNFGTAVAFLPNPTEAARQATAEHKLVFVLHISGNFEDDRFT